MGVVVRQKVKGRDEPWWVFIRHRGHRKSKCVGDKKSAEALAKELRQALAAGDLGLLQDPQPDGITFGEYAKRYLDRVEPDTNDPEHGLKRSTWRDYKGCLENRLIPALGGRPLTSIKRRDVKDLATQLRAAGLAAGNTRKHLRVLSSVLSEAVEDELIDTNPVMALRKHRRSKLQQGAGRRIDPLTPAELTALLTTAQMHTVDRAGETVHLTCPPRPVHSL